MEYCKTQRVHQICNKLQTIINNLPVNTNVTRKWQRFSIKCRAERNIAQYRKNLRKILHGLSFLFFSEVGGKVRNRGFHGDRGRGGAKLILKSSNKSRTPRSRTTSYLEIPVSLSLFSCSFITPSHSLSTSCIYILLTEARNSPERLGPTRRFFFNYRLIGMQWNIWKECAVI